MTEQPKNVDSLILCKYNGGSHAYGLNTPDSDKDIRGVFALKDIGVIIDPHQYNSATGAKYQGGISEGVDEGYYELRHFFNLLRVGNTNSVEVLFNNDWIVINSFFKQIIANRHQLVDSNRLYISLRGYITSETKLALGERIGKLGNKRKENLDRYGYSFKNVVQILRLAHCGITYFNVANFPVNIEKSEVYPLLYDIKTNPKDYNKNEVIKLINEAEKRLIRTFEKTTIHTIYNQDLANQLMIDCYFDIIQNNRSEIKPWWKRLLIKRFQYNTK